MKEHTMQWLAGVLKAVADPTRQRIMRALRQKGELSVGEIVRVAGVTQPATSQHLRVLREAGVVQSRKDGQQMYYRLCSKRMYDAISELVHVFQKEIGKGGFKKP